MNKPLNIQPTTFKHLLIKFSKSHKINTKWVLFNDIKKKSLAFTFQEISYLPLLFMLLPIRFSFFLAAECELPFSMKTVAKKSKNINSTLRVSWKANKLWSSDAILYLQLLSLTSLSPSCDNSEKHQWKNKKVLQRKTRKNDKFFPFTKKKFNFLHCQTKELRLEGRHRRGTKDLLQM